VSKEDFYRELASEINRTLKRKAVTSKQIQDVVEQARYIRRSRGLMGLWAFASELPYRFFTHEEIELLKRSPKWHEFTSRMIDLMVIEGVITPAEAGLLKRYQ
jgi:hypothetical protein